jgi:hypothetical protein
MGTFVIVVTAIELRLNHRKHPVPSKILQILKCRCKNSVKHADSSDSVQRDTPRFKVINKNITWVQ